MPGIWLNKVLAFLKGDKFVEMQLPYHSVPSSMCLGEGAGLGFNSSQGTRGEPVSCVT